MIARHTDSSSDPSTFFQRQLTEGRMVESLEVEKSADRDDDWLVFRFGKPEAAISPFRSARGWERGCFLRQNHRMFLKRCRFVVTMYLHLTP